MRIKYGNEIIEYEVIRKERKTLSITVRADGSIIVSAPFTIDEEKIEKTVLSKAKWIWQKLKLVSTNSEIFKGKEYISGESFAYLGKNYRLKITIDKTIKLPSMKLYRGKFEITVNENNETIIKNTIEKWYREQAKLKIEERIKIYGEKLRLLPNEITVKELKKSWGTCTSKGNITLNWKIIMTPLSVIDYVVIHELCHLKYHNHSKEFWNLLGVYIPDYQKKKEWLKINGSELKI